MKRNRKTISPYSVFYPSFLREMKIIIPAPETKKEEKPPTKSLYEWIFGQPQTPCNSAVEKEDNNTKGAKR